MTRTKSPIERTIRLNMTISDEERDLAERLSALEGVTMSDYIRALLRREGAARLGWQPKALRARKALSK